MGNRRGIDGRVRQMYRWEIIILVFLIFLIGYEVFLTLPSLVGRNIILYHRTKNKATTITVGLRPFELKSE